MPHHDHQEKPVVRREHLLPNWLREGSYGDSLAVALSDIVGQSVGVFGSQPASSMGPPGTGPAIHKEGRYLQLDRTSDPYMAAHEVGHILDLVLGTPEASGGEKKVSRRKHRESAGSSYDQTHMQPFRGAHKLLMYPYSAWGRETKASMWGSHLMFPDSVPDFSSKARDLITEKDLVESVDMVRRILSRGNPNGR